MCQMQWHIQVRTPSEIWLVLQGQRQKKKNPAPTCSSAQTVTATILPTLINACFGITGSTGSGIRKNTLRSVKIGLNQSVLKQTMLYTNDC